MIGPLRLHSEGEISHFGKQTFAAQQADGEGGPYLRISIGRAPCLGAREITLDVVLDWNEWEHLRAYGDAVFAAYRKACEAQHFLENKT